MSKKEYVLLIIISLSIAIITGLAIRAGALRNDHLKYMNNYVGRSFIHKNDTIKVLEYDVSKDRFIVTGIGKISVNELYELKEVKSW